MQSDSKVIAAAIGKLLALTAGSGRVGNPFQVARPPTASSRSNQKLITLAMGILLSARIAPG